MEADERASDFLSLLELAEGQAEDASASIARLAAEACAAGDPATRHECEGTLLAAEIAMPTLLRVPGGWHPFALADLDSRAQALWVPGRTPGASLLEAWPAFAAWVAEQDAAAETRSMGLADLWDGEAAEEDPWGLGRKGWSEHALMRLREANHFRTAFSFSLSLLRRRWLLCWGMPEATRAAGLDCQVEILAARLIAMDEAEGGLLRGASGACVGHLPGRFGSHVAALLRADPAADPLPGAWREATWMERFLRERLPRNRRLG